MSLPIKEEKADFLVCPACQGQTLLNGQVCPECQGMSLGQVIGSHFVYWQKNINAREIFSDKLNDKFNKILDAILIVLGAGGLAALFYAGWQSGLESFFSYRFWHYQENLLFFFWLGLTAFGLLFYRSCQRQAKKRKIAKKVFDQTKPLNPPASMAELKKLNPEQKINVYQVLSLEAKKIIEEAWLLAQKIKHPAVRPLHLLAALLVDKNILIIFGRLGIKSENLFKKIKRALAEETFTPNNELLLSPELKKILVLSFAVSYQNRQPKIKPEDLLIALAQEESLAKEVLYDLEIDFNKLVNVASWIKTQEILRQNWLRFKGLARLRPKGAMNKAMTAVATPTLDLFSQDLTELAKLGYLAPCLDREQEFEAIFRIFSAGPKSIILVGNPGIGKKTIIQGLAQRMVAEDVPALLQDKRLVSLSLAKLIGGTAPEEAQNRLIQILLEIRRAGNVVLFIEGLQDLTGISVGQKQSLDLAEILAKPLAQGQLLVLATCLPRDYTRYLENSSLGQILQKINVAEPDENATIQILEAKSGYWENKYQVFFSYAAIEAAAKLASRFIHEKFMPTKAIDLLEETAVYTKAKKGAKSLIEAREVQEIISKKTNIPTTTISERESSKLLNLENLIHGRIIDQEEAVKMVASSLRRARAELRDVKRPIANLLFLGPTGVGKTELAKTVAEVFFGDENTMIRIDMSEYQEKVSLQRLIGAPGEEEGGQLTEAVRKNPYCLLLLDEIEKGHPDILNVFLQVMDEGRLTDTTGRVIDFTNLIFIGTSNACTPFIQDEIKKGTDIDTIRKHLLERELKPYFKPEFINRFDGIVVFKPLSLNDVQEIAKLMLRTVAKDLETKGVILEYTPRGLEEIARAGFDPLYGARPLRRVIQEKIRDHLATLVLENKLKRRDKVIIQGLDNLQLIESKKL